MTNKWRYTRITLYRDGRNGLSSYVVALVYKVVGNPYHIVFEPRQRFYFWIARGCNRICFIKSYTYWYVMDLWWNEANKEAIRVLKIKNNRHD